MEEPIPDALLTPKQAGKKPVQGEKIFSQAHDRSAPFLHFRVQEQGMSVSILMIMAKALQISREFKDKSKISQYNIVKRFVRTQGMVHRMGMHESQHSPAETQQEALDYIQTIRPKLAQPCRHNDYILNMDQTPIPFTFNPKSTLNIQGTRTVNIRKSTNDTKRATCALTITPSGKLLTPLFVFKGKPGAKIETREFPTYLNEMVYACQDNAWMDERVVLLWVDKILKPYVDDAPDGIVPLLFLDSYRYHMMASVVEKIQGLGVEVEHIPGRCTCLCQPVDIVVNKPFKKLMRDSWTEWMVEEGLDNGTPPTRANIMDWALGAKENISPQHIQNSWRHGEYSWFVPNTAKLVPVGVAVEDMVHGEPIPGVAGGNDSNISSDNSSLSDDDKQQEAG